MNVQLLSILCENSFYFRFNPYTQPPRLFSKLHSTCVGQNRISTFQRTSIWVNISFSHELSSIEIKSFLEFASRFENVLNFEFSIENENNGCTPFWIIYRNAEFEFQKFGKRVKLYYSSYFGKFVLLPFSILIQQKKMKNLRLDFISLFSILQPVYLSVVTICRNLLRIMTGFGAPQNPL